MGRVQKCGPGCVTGAGLRGIKRLTSFPACSLPSAAAGCSCSHTGLRWTVMDFNPVKWQALMNILFSVYLVMVFCHSDRTVTITQRRPSLLDVCPQGLRESPGDCFLSAVGIYGPTGQHLFPLMTAHRRSFKRTKSVQPDVAGYGQVTQGPIFKNPGRSLVLPKSLLCVKGILLGLFGSVR